jgi:thiol-disulfide isomerase/thioredoxin
MLGAIAIASVLLTGQQAAQVEGPIATIKLTAVDGRQIVVPDPKATATVLVFLLTDCPIANRYAPELKRIEKDYAKKKVVFYRVYVDRETTVESINEHTKDFEYKWPAVLDADHRLVLAVGAKVTPEVALITQDGKLQYKGRIDDWYIEHGRLREQEYRRDLRIALDEVLSEKQVSITRTPALGCFIETY